MAVGNFVPVKLNTNACLFWCSDRREGRFSKTCINLNAKLSLNSPSIISDWNFIVSHARSDTHIFDHKEGSSTSGNT